MSFRDFQLKGMELEVTDEMKEEFQKSGFILIRGLLDEEELTKVKISVEQSEDIKRNSYGVADDENQKIKMCLWNHPGNDVTGMVARSEKVAGTCEQLLGGEVYHYHTKLMMKEAKTGRKFIWHQDYGYWYNNGCVFPDMMTVFIAVDQCLKENGCLQVLAGSHKCGRIDHKLRGGQVGADLERVKEIEKKCPLVFVEMQQGDALFFHCNLLHTSSANNSHHRRWALLSAYNKATNDPYKVHHCPNYTPLYKVPNSAIKDCQVLWDDSDKDMLAQRVHRVSETTDGAKDTTQAHQKFIENLFSGDKN